MAGSEQDVPQWKRDLIERRRATGRILGSPATGVKLTCPGVVAAVRQAAEPGPGPGPGPDASAASATAGTASASDFHPASARERPSPCTSVIESVGGNMRLVEQREDLTFNGGSLESQPELIGRTMARVGKQYLAKVDSKNEDECHSDSSEELQYGPGIVKRLKSKYLSMTLRESQKKGARPSLSSLRRATSLENLLDEETAHKQTDNKQARFNKRAEVGRVRSPVSGHQPRSPRSVEPSPRDMKRARSMETLLRYDPKLNVSHSNSGLNVHLEDAEKGEECEQNGVSDIQKEEQLLLRKKLAITVEEAELPPPDLVKQTLKIFETSGSPGSASPPVPPPRSGYSSNPKPVAKVNNSVSVKPQLSPKPVFSPEKLRRVPAKVTSPKKVVDKSDIVPVSDSGSIASVFRRVPDTPSVPVTPVSPVNAVSPFNATSPMNVRAMSPVSAVSPMNSVCPINATTAVSPVTPMTPVSRSRSPPSPRKTMGLPILSPTEDKPPPIPRREKSPTTSMPATPTTPVNGNSLVRPETLDVKPIFATSDSEDEPEEVDGASNRQVSSSALENIRKDGTSMQFSFGPSKANGNEAANSHLPRVKPTPPKDLHIPPKTTPTSTVRSMSPFENHSQDYTTRPGTVINVSSLPVGAVMKSPDSPVQHVKQVGVIRPLVSTKNHSPPGPPMPPLTNREIEKNLINRVKSIEQPVTKVVVSLKKLPDDVVVGSVSHSALTYASNGGEGAGGASAPGASGKRGKVPGLWDKKPWHQQDNSMVFNFSNRKEVPDYIENDGLIMRTKRDKPRGGEGGVILLDANADESSTDGDVDVDEWGLVCSDPPSPCNVVFDGGNVLINGRSNLRVGKTSPRQRKLRIQFNDDATTMFEYPSEASLLDDTRGAPPSSAPPPPPSQPVPLGSGSLASYTPSKFQMCGGETFQLGVTRAPSTSSPSTSSPEDPASAASSTGSADTLEADLSVDMAEDGDHLKPARETESVPWSGESGTDLLF